MGNAPAYILWALGLSAIGWWFWDVLRVSSYTDFVHLPNGKEYPYRLGNRLAGPYGPFKGVEADLPKYMLHIYIDGHNGDYGRGMRTFAPKKQMINLEGNFNTYFQVYIPVGTEVLALSILTPDVMETLMNMSDRYDVEITGVSLRVISHKRPYGHIRRQVDLVACLEALCSELDQRMSSWTVSDETAARRAQLLLEDNPAVKIGRRSVRLTSVVLGAIFGPLGLIIWWLVIESWKNSFHKTSAALIEGCLLAFTFFPVLFLYLIIGLPRGWLNWLGRLMDGYARLNGRK